MSRILPSPLLLAPPLLSPYFFFSFFLPLPSLGKVIPEVLEQYNSVGATLNVLPYCTQFIPMEVIDGAENGSIIYHPSILPLHRGASAINW